MNKPIFFLLALATPLHCMDVADIPEVPAPFAQLIWNRELGIPYNQSAAVDKREMQLLLLRDICKNKNEAAATFFLNNENNPALKSLRQNDLAWLLRYTMCN